MFKLIYVSSARKLMSDDEFTKILGSAQRNNCADGITGIPFYCDGNFMQLLEGAERDGLATFDVISRDPRHDDIRRIVTCDSPDRWMKDWEMAFSHCGSKEEFASVVNLATGLDCVNGLIDGGPAFRNILTGFVERNLR